MSIKRKYTEDQLTYARVSLGLPVYSATRFMCVPQGDKK